MSTSTHQIQVKGVDKTAGAFQSIKNRAAATGADIRKLVGGAIAAAGAYLSVRAVADTVNELGHLSDIAQKTSTSVDELTRATTAMGVLGVNMDVEGLAKAFQLMEKNTGRSGLQGFYDTIGELGKIPEASERAAAAMQVFGRSGMEFMPLINAADESTDALEGVIAAMPGVSNEAAKAGDEASDAMRIAGDNFKSIWRNGIGTIVGWFSKNYEGGIRGATMNAMNSMTYYVKAAVIKVIGFFKKMQAFITPTFDAIGSFFGALIGGGSFSEAWEMAGQTFDDSMLEMEDAIEEIEAVTDRRMANISQDFENTAANIKKAAKDIAEGNAASSTANREARDLANLADTIQKAPAIRNELIYGGSNTALKAALLGPNLQNETKKQTSILEKIAKNTEKTAENTKESGETLAATDV